jgi:hypothetical protein
VKNRTRNSKRKKSRSTTVSVQTAQAERGAKVQTNNKNKTSNKKEKEKVQRFKRHGPPNKNDGTEDENRLLTSINRSSLPRRSSSGTYAKDLNKAAAGWEDGFWVYENIDRRGHGWVRSREGE